MIKSVLAAVAAAPLFAGAAIAGPYVNIEANSGFVGNDYEGTVTETHVGFEGDLNESATWYVQGGPALVSPDGEDLTTELSGKVGINVAATENLSIYGEVAAMTSGQIDFDEDLSIGTKAGVKFTF